MLSSANTKVTSMTEKLTSDDENDGSPVKGGITSGVGEAMSSGTSTAGGAVKGLFSGLKDKLTPGKGKANKTPKATKAMNIIEWMDVGVPVRVAYNLWTTYDQFPSFMKKVENVSEQTDEKVETDWKAQVFWSHRSWTATTLMQIPDERIVWRSKGPKGHVDGTVTFAQIAPQLTRICLVLEYYPQGFMERTGNIWRAAGRRARLEFKHFGRHVMTRSILEPDEIEGWRGTIRDSEIVETHEDAVARETDAGDEEQQNEGTEDQHEDQHDEEHSEEHSDA